jgi:hypothetical protein
MTEKPRLSPNAFVGACGRSIQATCGGGAAPCPLRGPDVSLVWKNLLFVDIASTKYKKAGEKR